MLRKTENDISEEINRVLRSNKNINPRFNFNIHTRFKEIAQ